MDLQKAGSDEARERLALRRACGGDNDIDADIHTRTNNHTNMHANACVASPSANITDGSQHVHGPNREYTVTLLYFECVGLFACLCS